MSPSLNNNSNKRSFSEAHPQETARDFSGSSSRNISPASTSGDRNAKRVCKLTPPTASSSRLSRSPPIRRVSPEQANGHSPTTNGADRSCTFVSPLSIAVVCSSNQNRSMEAHNLLKKRGYKVQSFGTGNKVKLPGPTIDAPNIYSFDTSYAEQFRDLKRKDQSFYTQNGLLNMLDRNKRIKEKPEKFQENKDEFDLVITCQERVFDQVLEDLTERGGSMCKMTHVINVEIKDNHDDATLGAFLIHELVKEICSSGDHEAEMESILSSLEKKKHKRFLYSPAFY